MPYANKLLMLVSFLIFTIIKFFKDRIPGTGGPGSQNSAGQYNQFVPTDNMFMTSRDEDKKFEVFPEVVLKGPIFTTASKYERYN